MIEAALLICSAAFGIDGCTEDTARRVVPVRMEAEACSVMARAPIVGAPDGPLAGAIVRVLCGRKV